MESRIDLMLGARGFISPPGEDPSATEGSSPVEQLLRQFEEHEREERKTLEEYREAIEKTEDSIVTFLLNCIRRDEETHCETLNAMLSTLKREVFWVKPPSAIDVSRSVGSEKEEYNGLFTVLLRALGKDAEKHLMVLKFLREYLKAA